MKAEDSDCKQIIDEASSGRKASEFTRFIIADLEGTTYEVATDNFTGCPVFAEESTSYALLLKFISNELGGAQDDGRIPKHIEYMRNHDLLDYCDVSEKGHYKWLPKGLLIQKLLLDYASDLATAWGAFEMKNPLVIRGDHNLVGELMGEFHERDYRVDGGRGTCYLRYASDPLAFPFMQKVQFSHSQSPLKVYEEAICFRNEQQGEVSGLKRVRNFLMTDMHAACSSVAEARLEFEALCTMFADLMDRIIAPGRWVLGWEGTIDFYNENRDWLIGIGKRINAPAFFKLMPQMSHYYAMKNEFQAITGDNANIQISTVQWDVKDGPRFNIGSIDETGAKQPCPVIIHASSFGSIERTLCAILENIAVLAAEGEVAGLPTWLAPTQVRAIPVSGSNLETAARYCDRMSAGKVRADLDDRNETVAKRIRDAEKEWIPYIIVVGDREAKSEQVPVRVRASGEIAEMRIDSLIESLASETDKMPFRPLPLPQQVSRRPVFLG